MLCYNYDNVTNEYLYSAECALDPLETERQSKDVWMLPANATFTEPPAAQSGFVRVWQKVKWTQVEDHRGTKYWLPGDTWDSEPKEMKDLGPLPNDYMLTAPSKPLEEVRTDKLSELDNLWSTAEETGVIQSSLGFPVDANERANRDVVGLISQMEMTSINKTQFCDANNDFHEVTLDNLKVLQLELIQYAQALYATKWQLRASIEAATTVDELNAIDIKFVTDFTPTPVVLTPDTPTGGTVIDEQTSGPAIARALEWVGGTPDALAAGALQGLAKSGYSTSEDATTMLGAGYTAWCHEFTGTGDVTQTMPNITNERDGFLLFIKNSKTSGTVTLVPGGLGDTIDGNNSVVIPAGHSIFFVSCDAQNRWVTIFNSAQHESKKPLYIESDTATSLPNGWHRVVLAFQNSSSGIITQVMPDLSKTVLGAHMQVRNIRNDGGSVDLVPFEGQLINGSTSALTVDPGTDVFLLAEGDDWFVWQTVTRDPAPAGNSLKVDNKQVDVLNVQYPLEANVDVDTNTCTLNINSGAYQPMMAPGIYATLSDDVTIIGRQGTELHTGKIFCDEVIYPGDPFLQLNPMTKGLTIQDINPSDDPNVSGGTPFLVVAHIAFDQIANEDFDITCRLWSKKQGGTEEQILSDSNGRLMSVTTRTKTGEQIKDVVIEGIVMAKQMQDIGISISHNGSAEPLRLGGRVRGGTCLVAQAITSTNHTGNALIAYEQDFKRSVLFEKKYFGTISDVAYSLGRPIAEQTAPARTGILQADGWGVDNIDPLKIAVTPDHVLALSSTDTGVADFFFGWTSNVTDTQSLLGKTLDVSYVVKNPRDAFNVVLLKWTDETKPATALKMSSRTNETVTWAPGWEQVATKFIAENSSNTFMGSTATFTIPEDAVQFAIGLVPVEAQNPIDLQIKHFKIETATPFYSFEMAGSDILKARSTSKAIFTHGFFKGNALRYTINDTYQPIPTGKLSSGSAKITVDNNLNNIVGSVIEKDGGVYILGEDATVTSYLKVLLANEQNTESTVEFRMCTFDEDGKATEIPNCSTTFKVPAKQAPTFMKSVIPSFTIPAGTMFALQMKSDKKDGAYLQSYGTHPLLSLTMVTS